MNWDTIRGQVARDDEGKWDANIPVSSLILTAAGSLEVRKNGHAESFALSEYALGQLCQKLSIPVRYFRRLPSAIQSQLVNHDLRSVADDQFLLRGKADTVRAVLSDKYVAYNNSDVIEAVSLAVEQNGLVIKNFDLDDRALYIKLTTRTVVDEVLQLKAGVMISNSEVGFAQVAVEPFLYRKPCTNDLVVTETLAFRHRHLNFSSEKFNDRVAQGVTVAMQASESAVAAVWAADEKPVADPAAEIERLGKAWKLAKPTIEAAKTAYQEEPRATHWGLANSFTRAAQRLQPVQRIELERMAGRLIAANP